MRALLRTITPHLQGILGAAAVAVGVYLVAGLGVALIVTGGVLLVAQAAGTVS